MSRSSCHAGSCACCCMLRGMALTACMAVVARHRPLAAVSGVLKGYDQLLNLVLDEAVEYLRGKIAAAQVGHTDGSFWTWSCRQALLSDAPEHVLGDMPACSLTWSGAVLMWQALFPEGCRWHLRPGSFCLCFRLELRCIASVQFAACLSACACRGQLFNTVAWYASPATPLVSLLDISDTCRYAASFKKSLTLYWKERDL